MSYILNPFPVKDNELISAQSCPLCLAELSVLVCSYACALLSLGIYAWHMSFDVNSFISMFFLATTFHTHSYYAFPILKDVKEGLPYRFVWTKDWRS